MAAPPVLAIVLALKVPVVVTLTAPPLPLVPPAVLKAPRVALLPVSVIEPAAPPVPVPVAAPVDAVTPTVPSVPVPVAAAADGRGAHASL
ncbi:MAG: hypothetical protein B7X88_24535 [Polaromonas sp. 17-63-33]|nr:MAG: hypothetical protein B7X88_24535 [Polaromonas sp. 17-63-33]